MNTKKECKTCKGTGHDYYGRPTVTRKLATRISNETGKLETYMKHTTEEVGSGCPNCLGLGYLKENAS